MRHAALLLEQDVLHVFYSRAGDVPERLLHGTVDLTAPFADWAVRAPTPAWLSPL